MPARVRNHCRTGGHRIGLLAILRLCQRYSGVCTVSAHYRVCIKEQHAQEGCEQKNYYFAFRLAYARSVSVIVALYLQTPSESTRCFPPASTGGLTHDRWCRRLHGLAVITKRNEFVIKPYPGVQPEMTGH